MYSYISIRQDKLPKKINILNRSGKEEALTDELQTADTKVEHLRNALQLISKRLATAAGNTQGQDPAAREKRLKKLPEYLLGLSMCEASNYDDDDSILKYILYECGMLLLKYCPLNMYIYKY